LKARRRKRAIRVKIRTGDAIQRTEPQLERLKKEKAANDAEILRLQAKIKIAAEKRAAERGNRPIKNTKDEMSEMDSASQLALQQATEKKSQLESMISNVMKAGSE
jgi:hypothetical protein